MTIVPKNWKDFQHYRHRNPPWIKLHKRLLDDYDFHRLPVASKAIAPCLWLIASESPTGEIDASEERLSFRLHMTQDELRSALTPLINAGFFVKVQDASKPLASCGQAASEMLLQSRVEESLICVDLPMKEFSYNGAPSATIGARIPRIDPNFDERVEPFWKRVQALFVEVRPNIPPPALDHRRKCDMSRAMDIYTEEQILNAVRWMLTSPDFLAHSLRSNGKGISSLLDPGKIVDFVEAASDPSRWQSPSRAGPAQSEDDEAAIQAALKSIGATK